MRCNHIRKTNKQISPKITDSGPTHLRSECPLNKHTNLQETNSPKEKENTGNCNSMFQIHTLITYSEKLQQAYASTLHI